MPSVTQRNFGGGEIAPGLRGRSELASYGASVKSLKNVVVGKHGSLRKRPGTEILATHSAFGGFCRVLPFVVDDATSYALVFDSLGDHPLFPGYGWAWVYSSGAKVARTSAPTWSSTTTYAESDVVEHPASSGNYFDSLQGANLNMTPGAVGSELWWSQSNHVRVRHYYKTAVLKKLKWAQSGDILILTEVGTRPKQIKRLSHSSWTISDVPLPMQRDHDVTGLAASGGIAGGNASHPARDWTWQVVPIVKGSDGVWVEQRADPRVQVTLVAIGLGPATPPVVLTWTQPTGTAGANVRYRIYRGRNSIYGLVGESYAQTFTDDGFAPDLSQTPLVSLELDNALLVGSGKAPGAVAYYEQRLTFGGSSNQPSTLWMSKAADFYSFGECFPPSADPSLEAISVKLAAYQLEQIKAFVPLRKLLAFTGSSVFELGANEGEPLTARSIGARRHVNAGIGDLQPLAAGAAVLFVGPDNNTIHDLGYRQESDGFVPRDLSALASHLFEGRTIVDWTYQRRPERIIWATLDDGTMVGLTYNPDQEILGWHHHDTAGSFESVCSIPEGGADVVYMVVKRTLMDAGTAKELRVLERMSFSTATDFRLAKHLDCAHTAHNGINTDTAKSARLEEGEGWATTDHEVVFDHTPTPTPSVGRVIWLRQAARASRGPGDPALPAGYIALTVTEVVSPTRFEVSRAPLSDTTPLRDRWTTLFEIGVAEASAGPLFSGIWPANGLAQPLVVYADGVPTWQTTTAAGVFGLAPPAAVIYLGFGFTAEIEFLDALMPGQMPGIRKKVLKQLAVDMEGAVPPALGDGLSTLNDEETTSATVKHSSPKNARQIIPRNVGHVFTFEAGGAMKQTWPFPLLVLGLIREVDYGG